MIFVTQNVDSTV